ncbi:MAG: hypothetical protein KC502_23110, partial [Myxococcales bacterium]|nr:hypothetical protein [Myxococcales bacterium]
THDRPSRWFVRCAAVTVALTGLLALAPAGVLANPVPWTLVGTTDGVLVHTRKLPGVPVPQMRGQVTIKASLYDVFAVLEDTPRHIEWMAKTSGSRLVQPLGKYNRVVWTRKKTPWPSQDRDAVLRVAVTVQPKRIFSRFAVTKSAKAPKLSGVTRMPALDGSFELISKGPQTTVVKYVLLANMGGWIPDWLSRLIARKLPLRDLQGLRRQTLKMRGKYEAFLNKNDPSRAPKPPAVAPKPAAPAVPQPATRPSPKPPTPTRPG